MTFTTVDIRSDRYTLIDYVSVLKEASSCMDCGQHFPACCMDFDHRPNTKKLSSVGHLVMKGTLTEVEDEMAKCDLVCANCHRIRTRDRRHTARGLAGRALREGQFTQRSIARQYGISESLVSELKRAASGVQRRKQLTHEQHAEIRQLRTTGMKQADLAQLFNCSQSHISLIVRGKRAV